jgi:hypothetical protein
MLFQIRKHYKLFSNPTFQVKQKKSITRAAIRPAALEVNSQNRPASKYYFHKLPELEVSISSDHDIASYKLPELEVSVSSDQDIASFANKTFIKESVLTKDATRKTAKKSLLRNPISKKKKLKPVQVARPTHKVILNNYIDDFFIEPAQKEIQESDHFACLDFQINSPANDEIITVNKPSEMV